MVLHLSDLEPDCCEIQYFTAPNSNNGQEKIEHARKKKVKKNNPETKADSSSSDHSSFVALVTASNLHNDALDLPQDLTISAGLTRKCREIVVTDEREERSWTLDLRFNKSSDTFYISRGWRNLCDENGKKTASVFVFKLVGNEETPLLSFCSTESINDRTQRDKNNKETCVELERKKKRMRCSDSISPRLNRFVTLTITDYSLKRGLQYLPMSFTRENGLSKPGMIALLGKDATKCAVNLRREGKGTMLLGQGWNDFMKANGLKKGESFTLESTWENGTPMLSLLSTESTSERMQQGECSEDCEPSGGNKTKRAKNNREERRDSFSAIQNRFVTLTLTHKTFRKGCLGLPLSFTKENGLTEPMMITLLSKDCIKWVVNLQGGRSEQMFLGKGLMFFIKANGLKSGESFTLESTWENGTPMLSLSMTDSISDRRQQRERSEDSDKNSISIEPSGGNKTKKANNNIEERRDPSSAIQNSISIEPSCGNKTKKAKNNIEERRVSPSAIQNRFVTLTLTPEDVRDCKLILPSEFMKANGINKLGKINILGKTGMKWFAYLLSKNGFVAVGSGWKGFCEANGVKIGESFTLECIHEQDTTLVFKFCSNYEE
ncbi:B3 domain-containing protein REM12 [Cardamine amara subsp. amara]|uniref:B3 domain-containing protein REM12 n=1 Tax=Cardamine amara subsp. amara TaxID=228776 RepID=A0ABD1BWN0_CARAN